MSWHLTAKVRQNYGKEVYIDFCNVKVEKEYRSLMRALKGSGLAGIRLRYESYTTLVIVLNYSWVRKVFCKL
jgi:hypothetical protein